MLVINLKSYGPNLPLSFKIVSENSEQSEKDTPNYCYLSHQFTIDEEEGQDMLYMFRKHISVTQSEWIIKKDLDDCLNQALIYYQSDSAFDEDVIVHCVPNESSSNVCDPDQISISHLLRTPGRYIIESFTMFMTHSNSMSEKDCIENAVGMWNDSSENEMKLIKAFLSRYPIHIPTFAQKLAESNAFSEQNQIKFEEQDNPDNSIERQRIGSVDEIYVIIRSCREWLSDNDPDKLKCLLFE